VDIRGAVSEWLRPADGQRRSCAPVSPHWTRTRASLAKHLVAAIGERELDELGPADVWTVQDHCRGAGLSAETANKCTHHLLPAMLRDLELAGIVAEGTKARVMRGCRKLRAEGVSSGVALSCDERDRLLGVYRGHWAAALVAFLFVTGVRVGEAAGIRQSDVDWHRQTVRIVRSRRGEELSATKSRRSQRTLKLPRAAVAAIQSLRRDDDPEAFVFRGPEGAALDVDNFRRRTWGKMVKRARIRAIRIHDTRHTFATLALEAGIPAAEVAKYLGDKVQTLEARYNHVVGLADWDHAIAAPTLRRAV
jgi:integrase